MNNVDLKEPIKGKTLLALFKLKSRPE